MPATPAPTLPQKQKAGAPAAPSTAREPAQNTQQDGDEVVRLHITPFNPALLKVYLPPSVLPVAKNISYHHVETFPEKGFGYVDLPVMEAQKLKKKLNGSTLKGSKVRIENAKPEKRKAGDDAVVELEEEERQVKRAKKAKKKKKEDGVLEGVELPNERKVKRGWTEVPVKGKKEKRDKKDKDKDKKAKRRESRYTKEPEVLFKAKLTPVAATEVARKEKKDKKKSKSKSRSKQEVVVHEFEKNIKTPSFLKAATVSTEKKPAVEYINGKGWVDEDGNVVEAETGKARNRRALELVDAVPQQTTFPKQASATPSPKSSPAPKVANKEKKKTKEATRPLVSSESDSKSDSESEESSVVSSSSEDETSGSEASAGASVPVSPTTLAPAPKSPPKAKSNTPEIAITPSSPDKKEVHPLEALFKKPKPSSLLTPSSNLTSTPGKNLAPINTAFSFFGDADVDSEHGQPVDDAGAPFTPHTQRDLEWRGLRSAAPTPDTAAIGRRFSFPWRNSSQEIGEDEGEKESGDAEAEMQLSSNTKANASSSQLPNVTEEDEEDATGGAEQGGEGEEEESEFQKWFWENQGNLNRAWKRRRRDAVKTKRSVENRRAVGGRRAA